MNNRNRKKWLVRFTYITHKSKLVFKLVINWQLLISYTNYGDTAFSDGSYIPRLQGYLLRTTHYMLFTV